MELKFRLGLAGHEIHDSAMLVVNKIRLPTLRYLFLRNPAKNTKIVIQTHIISQGNKNPWVKRKARKRRDPTKPQTHTITRPTSYV